MRYVPFYGDIEKLTHNLHCHSSIRKRRHTAPGPLDARTSRPLLDKDPLRRHVCVRWLAGRDDSLVCASTLQNASAIIGATSVARLDRKSFVRGDLIKA